MKREILFKAKRKDNGQWVEGNLTQGFVDNIGKKGRVATMIQYHYVYHGKIGALTKEPLQTFKSVEVDPDTVSQYIQDFSGEAVFQNDIVVYLVGEYWFYGIITASLSNGISIKSYGEVIFKGHPNQEFKRSEKTWFPKRFFNVEKIGNKWDSPELLK